MEIGGTGFASIAFGYPNALWGEPQSPGSRERREENMFFAGMALGAMAGAAFGIGTDVLCGCRKAGRSADGTDADTQTETGRTENNPFPRYGRVGAVLSFGWGKPLHDGRGRNKRDWTLPLCGRKAGGCEWAGLGDRGIPLADGAQRNPGVSLTDSIKEEREVVK